jgi:hypothetical protein
MLTVCSIHLHLNVLVNLLNVFENYFVNIECSPYLSHRIGIAGQPCDADPIAQSAPRYSGHVWMVYVSGVGAEYGPDTNQ